MAERTVEERLAELESQLKELREEVRVNRRTKDWRRTIGAFTDDPGMQQILSNAMELREADRRKTRAKTAKSATRKKP